MYTNNDNGLDGWFDTIMSTGTELYKGYATQQAQRNQRKLLEQQQAMLKQQQAIEQTRAKSALAMQPKGIMENIPGWVLPAAAVLIAKKFLF